MEKIWVEIKANGDTTVSVAGVKGPSCVEATRDIELALGKTIEDKKTPEFNERSQKIEHKNRA